MGTYDPEVEAAFGSAPAPSAAEQHYDPEVLAAFTDAEQKTDPAMVDRWLHPKIPSLGESALSAGEAGLSLVTGGVGALGGGLTYLGTLAATGDPDAAEAVRAQTADTLTYHPSSKGGKKLAEMGGEASRYLGEIPGKKSGGYVLDATGSPALATGAETLANVPQFLLGSEIFKKGAVRPQLEPVRPEAVRADPVTHGPAAGASGTAIDLSKAPPELQAEIAAAQKKGPVNQKALERQLDATTLPMPEGETPLHLRRSSALGEAQGHGDEFNMQGDPDTEGLIKNAIVGEDRKLAGSMGEIQRRANPDIVHMATDEHAQAAIRSVKELDNQRLTDIRDKYKAVADANGGNMPVDMGEAATVADASLKKNYLSKLADDHPVLGRIMDRLRSGEPMTFEDWEAGTKALSEVQRRGGSEARAAGIIRDQYENMPLAPEAANLRGMLNEAKTAYKSRMDDVENVPAYKAVVDDNVPMKNGLHDLDARSPLAEGYLKQHFTGTGKTASRAYVERMQSLMKANPEFAQHVEAGTLNTLRDAAGVDESGEALRGFKNVGYEKALANLRAKSDLLMRPEVQGHVEQLGRVAGYIKDQPAGAVPNRSGTALALMRHGAMYGADAGLMSEVASHVGTMAAGKVAGPAGVLAKQYIEGRFKAGKEAKIKESQAQAKLKYAQEATKAGAGIGYEPPPGSNH